MELSVLENHPNTMVDIYVYAESTRTCLCNSKSCLTYAAATKMFCTERSLDEQRNLLLQLHYAVSLLFICIER